MAEWWRSCSDQRLNLLVCCGTPMFCITLMMTDDTPPSLGRTGSAPFLLLLVSYNSTQIIIIHTCYALHSPNVPIMEDDSTKNKERTSFFFFLIKLFFLFIRTFILIFHSRCTLKFSHLLMVIEDF